MRSLLSWANEYFAIGIDQKVWAMEPLVNRVQAEAIAELTLEFGPFPDGTPALTPSGNWVNAYSNRGKSTDNWSIKALIQDVQEEARTRFEAAHQARLQAGPQAGPQAGERATA